MAFLSGLKWSDRKGTETASYKLVKVSLVRVRLTSGRVKERF
jgi:hypothetical protein